MHALLTVRKLKAGSYDDWRSAWQPDEWPEGAQKAYILRNVGDPDEIIAFGFFEGDLPALRRDRKCRTSSRPGSSEWLRTSSRPEPTACTR